MYRTGERYSKLKHNKTGREIEGVTFEHSPQVVYDIITDIEAFREEHHVMKAEKGLEFNDNKASVLNMEEFPKSWSLLA